MKPVKGPPSKTKALALAAVLLFLFSFCSKEEAQSPGAHWSGDYELRTDTCTLNLKRIPRELMEIAWARKLSFEELSKNAYYTLEVRAEDSFIPEEFASSLDKNLFFIIAGNVRIGAREPEALESEKKIIYSGENPGGPVFLRCFVYHHRDYKPEGLYISHLSANAPIIRKW